jgi:hypothetical protein
VVIVVSVRAVPVFVRQVVLILTWAMELESSHARRGGRNGLQGLAIIAGYAVASVGDALAELVKRPDKSAGTVYAPGFGYAPFISPMFAVHTLKQGD